MGFPGVYMVLLVLVPVVVLVSVAVGAGRRARADRVRVSVDDLAVGRLPPVCIKTGEPTLLYGEVESSGGGFEPWWLLLLLLGPLGIVAVVVLWVLGGRALRVGGEVPFSRAALDDYNRAARTARSLCGLGYAGIILGIGALLIGDGTGGSLLGGLAVGFILVGGAAALTARGVARWKWVDVELDGSGRWAVLIGVHPAFAAAVRQGRLQQSDPGS